MWSLIYELRISLIFPLLVFLTKRNWWLTLLSTVLIGAVCIKTLAFVTENSLAESCLRTGIYISMFVLGIMIAIHSQPLRRWVGAQVWLSRLVVWAVALTTLSFAPENTNQCRTLQGGRNQDHERSRHRLRLDNLKTCRRDCDRGETAVHRPKPKRRAVISRSRMNDLRHEGCRRCRPAFLLP